MSLVNFDKIYIIDYNKLIVWLLPTFLRRDKTFAWLQVLVAPIEGLYRDFLKYRKRVNYKLRAPLKTH